MAFTRSVFVSSLAATFASLAPRAGSAQTASPLTPTRIGVAPVEVCAEAFYGVDLGFFKKAGVDVELQFFSSPGAVSAALAGNAIDVGLFDSVGLIAAHARNVPIVFLAPGKLYEDSAPEISLVVRDDGPRSAKDVVGTVAAPSVNNIGALATLVWLDRNGGNSKRVKFVELPFPAMTDAVQRGSVIGAVSVEPWLSDARDKGMRTIAPANGLGPVFVASAWVGSQSWAESHAAVVAPFVSAIYTAGRWGNKNHAASIPIVSKYTKVAPETLAKMKHGSFAEATDLKAIQPVIDAMVNYEFIPKGFPASDLVYRGGKLPA
jgi:NitT/TauT family transport system substrate-binding protein